VGAQLAGFETMVKITPEAKFIVLEGDEYLASPVDRRPKFHLYHPHIALLSGIAWDHINVFPTFENYVDQFRIFIEKIEKDGTLVYCEEDAVLKKVSKEGRPDLIRKPYHVPPHEIKDGTTYLIRGDKKIPLLIFGDHNLMNAEGARYVCNSMGVPDEVFDE